MDKKHTNVLTLTDRILVFVNTSYGSIVSKGYEGNIKRAHRYSGE